MSALKENINSRFEDEYDVLTVQLADISAASSCYVVAPNAGYVRKIYSTISGAITVADAAITASIGGTNMTGGSITIAYSGSAAGDVDSCSPTANNKVNAGQAIKLTTDGGSTDTSIAVFTILINKVQNR